MAIERGRNPLGQRWDPWAEFGDFERAMNRVFGDLYPTRTEYPPINIWTAKDDVVLTAELPGLEPEDLDVSVQENILTLRCTPREKERAPKEGETVHRRECVRASFSRSWRLPFEVDGDKVDAKFENGILKLMLPRSEASKPKKIDVKTK